MMNGTTNGTTIDMWLMMLGMWLGVTLWILLLALLAWALIRWLIGRSAQPGATTPVGPSAQAQAILEERYARGEIDQATFQQMREQLRATRPA